MAKEKSTDNRARTWTAVVYPDSAPENWQELLDEQHIPWACSPLHDCDTNANGEVKKPHWHIVVSFEGKKSYEQICELLQPLNGPIPQRCHDVRGIVRYFAHLDNPEKYQYSVSDIVAHGGFDVCAALQPSASERYTLIGEMVSFVRENGLTEFQDLMDYAMDCRRDDWFPLLCDSCAFVMQQYLKSARHRTGGVAGGEFPRDRGDSPPASDPE